MISPMTSPNLRSKSRHGRLRSPRSSGVEAAIACKTTAHSSGTEMERSVGAQSNKVTPSRARSVIAEASELLACLASQPSTVSWLTDSNPARWSPRSVLLAQSIWNAVQDDGTGRHLDAYEHYAEAECRLRDQLRGVA